MANPVLPAGGGLRLGGRWGNARINAAIFLLRDHRPRLKIVPHPAQANCRCTGKVRFRYRSTGNKIALKARKMLDVFMENNHHPIESLMQTAMENEEMADVNVLGDTVETPTAVIAPPRVSGFGRGNGV